MKSARRVKSPITITKGMRVADVERALQRARFKPGRLLPNIRNWSRKIGKRGRVYEDVQFWCDERTGLVVVGRYSKVTHSIVDLNKQAVELKAMLARVRGEV